MNLEGVVEILEAQGVATPGKDLFINFMPADKVGLLLRPPFGGTPIDHELPGYRSTSFMLVVRHPNPSLGKELMAAATAALTIDNAVAGNMRINYMRPRTEPLVYQPSAGGNIELITDIDASYVLL
jgi:hypothetical protein